MAFQRIKDILDAGLDTWEAHNYPPDLSGHSEGFGKQSWATKASLLTVVAHGQRLIQPEVIGNNRGHEANLVRDLRTGINPPALDRMPIGGPFIADVDIQTIEDWINAGCPD